MYVYAIFCTAPDGRLLWAIHGRNRHRVLSAVKHYYPGASVYRMTVACYGTGGWDAPTFMAVGDRIA